MNAGSALFGIRIGAVGAGSVQERSSSLAPSINSRSATGPQQPGGQLRARHDCRRLQIPQKQPEPVDECVHPAETAGGRGRDGYRAEQLCAEEHGEELRAGGQADQDPIPLLDTVFGHRGRNRQTASASAA